MEEASYSVPLHVLLEILGSLVDAVEAVRRELFLLQDPSATPVRTRPRSGSNVAFSWGVLDNPNPEMLVAEILRPLDGANVIRAGTILDIFESIISPAPGEL